ncbi:MAG: GNAT family N-acetyltransferase [Betaproteobacteria bacterium]
MPDLLVKLYDLPAVASTGPHRVRVAMAYEKHALVDWVRREFGVTWASECDVAFAKSPISCYIATVSQAIVGFACYDTTCRGFFGPIGVTEAMRGRGIGRDLLLTCLQGMASVGYGYAVVGGATCPAFYTKAVEAIEIPGSSPGIYRDRLKTPTE